MDLACTSDGTPLPIVTWTKISQALSDSYPSGQRLAITHANRTDAGTYVCTATNGIGKPAKATRHLNVFCTFIYFKVYSLAKQKKLIRFNTDFLRNVFLILLVQTRRAKKEAVPKS